MADIEDGGSAFPSELTNSSGMSMRDWFAGQALANTLICDSLVASTDANWAYKWADAMLERRQR